MALRITHALRDGLGRVASREAFGLVVAFAALQAANAVLAQSLALELFTESGEFPSGTTPTGAAGPSSPAELLPFALDLPVAPVVAALLVGVFVAEALRIVGVRMFASEATVSLSTAALRGGLGLATLNGVVAGIVVGVATGLGLALLVVPGLFIAVALFFVRQDIALEGKNFVSALTGSWALTRGSRLRVFVLAALLFVVNLTVSGPVTVLYLIDPATGVGLSVVLGPVVTVFGLAVTTRAYRQLRPDDGSPPAGPAGSAGPEQGPTGA